MPDKKLKIEQEEKYKLGETSRSYPDDMVGYISLIHNEFTKTSSACATWRTNQTKWFKQRYGIRPPANFPWKNSSNLHLPLVDKNIRKMKPEYTASVWNSKPMCSLTPVDSDNYQLAQESSWHLDWLLRSRMNIYPTLIRMSDFMLAKGFAIAKVVYSKKYEPKTVVFNKAQEKKKMSKELIDKGFIDIYDNPNKIQFLTKLLSETYSFDLQDAVDSEKVSAIIKQIYSAVDNVEFQVDALVYDAPEIVLLDPESVFVPADTITEFDLENAPLIVHRYPCSVQDVLDNVASGKWNKEVAMEILKQKGINNPNQLNEKLPYSELKVDTLTQYNKSYKNQREGQSNPTTKNLFMIHECCVWYDGDNDGKPERHILEYCVDYMQKDLRFDKYPYNMAMWPYVKIPFELTDGSHYSPRGIAEILHPLACALNEQHNMRMNRQYVSSTPWMFFNTDQVNYKNLQLSAPGKATGVKGNPNTAVSWINPPNTDQSFQYEENFITRWSEDISASSDMVQSNSSQTLGEARMNASARVSVRQQDIDIWNMALREVFKRVFALWGQFGPQIVATSTDSTGKVENMVKSSFMKNWEFNVNGKLGVSDPILQTQEALADLDRFNGDRWTDQYFLRQDYIMKKDPLKAKFLLRDRQIVEKEMADEQQQMLQAIARGEKVNAQNKSHAGKQMVTRGNN